MPANIDPIFSRTADFQSGGTLTTAAADYTGQNINNVVVFTADSSNGGFVQKLRFKALGTNVATVVRIYINNGMLRLAPTVAAPAGTPTGTPAGTGGTLATGTYYAKIVAIDQYGGQSAASTETAVVNVTGPTGSITWSWTASAGAASYKVYIGPVTGGQASYFTTTTNSYVQTSPVGQRDSLNGSVLNNFLFGEISLPATTASATTATPDLDYPMNIPIQAGYRVLAGLGTTVAAGWHVTAVAGAY